MKSAMNRTAATFTSSTSTLLLTLATAPQETHASAPPSKQDGNGPQDAGIGRGLLGGSRVHLLELGEGVALLDALDDSAVLHLRVVEHGDLVGAPCWGSAEEAPRVRAGYRQARIDLTVLGYQIVNTGV